MTLNEISTELRTLSLYVGGEHLKPKEAEAKIKALADELSETSMQLSLHLSKVDSITGINANDRFIYLRQQNIKELTND